MMTEGLIERVALMKYRMLAVEILMPYEVVEGYYQLSAFNKLIIEFTIT